MSTFHIIIRILGLEIPVSLPRRPQVGETITLKIKGQRLAMVFDGMGFFHPRKVEGTVIPADAKPVIEQPEPVARSIPNWALESSDPRVQYIIETLIASENATREAFEAEIYAGAWNQALLITGNASQEEDGLALRWAQMDAKQAKIAKRAVSDHKDIKRATKRPRIGKKDAAGEWLAALGQDDPITPDDAVAFAVDTADREALSDLVSAEAERDGDWGVERPHVDWKMDVIGQLLAWAGKSDLPREPLANVLATMEAKRELLSEKQRALADKLLADTEDQPTYSFRWANMIMPNGERQRREIMTRTTKINALARKADACEFLVDEALDEYENVQAAWDEEAHPRKDTTPKVEVSPERQLSWLDWVANQKAKGGKPWLERPTYISVLSYAFETQAKTPTEAHNRAYNADSLRYEKNVHGFDPIKDEFIVKVNKAGEIRRVPAADARVAYPHLPVAAKQKLNSLAKQAKGIS